MENWVRHFAELSGFKPDHEESIMPDDDLGGPGQCGSVPEGVKIELPTHISREMIIRGIKHIKHRKASGIDGVKNEIIIFSAPYILDMLHLLFNKMLHSRYFPEQWNLVMIAPLFKSGDQNDTNNYRGISLLSCLGKLFCTILNQYLSSRIDRARLLSDLQGGFRRRRGCREQSFLLLSSLYSAKRRRRGRVFCAFVDFRKAYDTVRHSILWNRLLSLGMGPKLVELLKSIYSKVKCSVRHGTNLSSFFDYLVGVRQGCVLSPLVFNLFIDELVKILAQGGGELAGVQVGDLIIFTLLYADDVVLIAKEAAHLQRLLNSLDVFCGVSAMSVNISKTMIVPFFSKSPLDEFSFVFVNKQLKVVNEYKYLGCYFDRELSFKFHIEAALQRAAKASFAFFSDIENLPNLKTSLIVRLYHTLVLSVLLYNVEVWGLLILKGSLKKLEKFHLSCLKRILKVGRGFSTAAVFWLLGVTDISTMIRLKSLKFLFSVRNNTDHPLFNSSLASIVSFRNKLGDQVKVLCQKCGIESLEAFFGATPPPPLQEFKPYHHKIVEEFWEGKRTELRDNRRLFFLSKFCKSQGLYEFLDKCPCAADRVAVTKFLGGCHHLRVEVGRWARVPREFRVCRMCGSEEGLVEDEEHVLFQCERFAAERHSLMSEVSSKFPTVDDVSSAFLLLVPQTPVGGDGNMAVDFDLMRKSLICGQYHSDINVKFYALIRKVMAKADQLHRENVSERGVFIM